MKTSRNVVDDDPRHLPPDKARRCGCAGADILCTSNRTAHLKAVGITDNRRKIKNGKEKLKAVLSRCRLNTAAIRVKYGIDMKLRQCRKFSYKNLEWVFEPWQLSTHRIWQFDCQNRTQCGVQFTRPARHSVCLRSWTEFKVGFNDSRDNYWIGNDLLHQLTTSGRYELRFDLQARDNGDWHYAAYNRFVVHSKTSNYVIRVSGYSGNAEGNGFSYHDGSMFTAYDRDNDQWSYNDPQYRNNCTVYNGGGFWYNSCASASVNGIRGYGDDFRWWEWVNGRPHFNRLLQTSRMWLMC